MKLLFVCSGCLPFTDGRGSSVLQNGLLGCMERLDFEVTILPYNLRYQTAVEKQKHIDYIDSKSIRLMDELRSSEIKKSKFTRLVDLVYPTKKSYQKIFGRELARLNEISKFEFDIIWGYDWGALEVISTIKAKHHVLSLVDLVDDLISNRRLGITQLPWKRKLREVLNLWWDRYLPRHYYKELTKVDLVVEHAAQHCRRLKELGFQDTIYVPHPMETKEKLYCSSKDKNDDVVNILILGSLKGIASRLGFEFFLNQVIPTLKNKPDQLNKAIRFRVVGHGEMLPSLKQRLLSEETVDFIGFADDLEQEYEIADLLLVNIPVSHGFRTRIAEAFSYGLCVVAHAANAEGMPEILDEHNALISRSAEGLVNKLIKAVNQPELRYKLGCNAAETFGKAISVDAAVARLQEALGHRLIAGSSDKKAKLS